MNIRGFLQRKLRQPDVDREASEPDPFEASDAVRRRQMMLLSTAGGIALVLGSIYIFSSDETPDTPAEDAEMVTVSTDDMLNRNMSQKEWMALSEGRLQSIDNRLKSVDGQAAQLEQLQAQLTAARGENASMVADGQRVVSAYQAENEQLRAALAAKPANAPAPGPTSMYGPGAPPTYAAQTAQSPSATSAGEASASVSRSHAVKLVAFEGGPAGTASRISGGSTSYTDSPNYLPPNSIARARVIVGVDASAGVNSQSDPLPVVLRITGPARSVYRDNQLLTTRIEGCLINGAARGDLSSEKVYVKLQRMTCPQAGGRFAVSDVKGFIAFGGKTGVRGRVVSREGGLVGQAFLAGRIGSFGRAFSANTEAVFGGTNVSVDGKRQKLGAGDILEGGFGGGAAQAGDMVSKYLIERAEQYQPVVEMPTGVDVEVVFLEGVFIQN